VTIIITWKQLFHWEEVNYSTEPTDRDLAHLCRTPAVPHPPRRTPDPDTAPASRLHLSPISRQRSLDHSSVLGSGGELSTSSQAPSGVPLPPPRAGKPRRSGVLTSPPSAGMESLFSRDCLFVSFCGISWALRNPRYPDRYVW
jgi:hypothetical protein